MADIKPFRCPGCGRTRTSIADCPYCGHSLTKNVMASPSVGSTPAPAVAQKSATYKPAHDITFWVVLAFVFVVFAVLSLVTGFDKMTNYFNGTYTSTNAYVGGDAYNYIINASYATAYFVLTGTCVIGAIGCGILHYLSKGKK